MAETERELTFGEKAVGLSFNPSNDPVVQDLKERYAGIIDELNNRRVGSDDPGQIRHLSAAITDAETAQMRAVKAVTWKS